MKVLKNAGKMAYKSWMTFAHFLGLANTTIMLSLVYFLLIGPLSLGMRILGRDLLDKRGNPPMRPFWKDKEVLKHTLEECEHQF